MHIKHDRKGRLAVLLLCICIASAFLFSSWYLVSHAEHDCTGAHCSVCAQLHLCADTMQKLGAGLCASATFAWLLAAALLCALLALSSFGKNRDTLVGLKVRLNN